MSTWGASVTWFWIIVHWRFELKLDFFKAECYLLYSFFWGGGVVLDKMFWFVMQPTRRNEPTHPEQLWSRVWNVTFVLLSFSQNDWGFIWEFSLGMPPSWGWKVPILFLLHKAQSIPFSLGRVGRGKEKKQLIKYHFALAWFSLIKPYNHVPFC